MRVRLSLAAAIAAVLLSSASATGQSAGESANPFGFTGHEHDPETGLIYMKGRYYDPETGRFITEDPVTGDPFFPPSLHPYLYANANPTVYRDPTGKYAESGHYYTVYYAALRAGYPNQQAQQLAFYSQLPDETTRLDAYSLQARATVTTRTEQSRHERDVAQRALHALTGGRSQAETEATVRAIRAAGPDLAATGVLLHRLGDSFAHRQIGAEERLYETGMGHGSAGTDPDKVLQRPGLYREYVGTLVDVLGEKRGLTPEQRQQLSATTNPLELRGTTFATLVRSGENPDTLTTIEGMTRGVVLEYLQAAGTVQVIDGQLGGNAGTLIADCLQSNSCQEAAFEHRIKGLVAEERGDLSYRPEDRGLFPHGAYIDRSIEEALGDYTRAAGNTARGTTPQAAARAVARATALQQANQPRTGVVRERSDRPGVVVEEDPPRRP